LEKAVVIGAGGHARSVIDIIQQVGQYEVVGVLDASYPLRKRMELMEDIPIMGDDSLLSELKNMNINNVFVAIGDNQLRYKLIAKVKAHQLKLIQVISPYAIISPRAMIGAGTCVMAGAAINVNSKIGLGVIINTNASIDHDCVIGDFVHIAPGTAISGSTRIGEGTHIGTNSSIIDRLCIGKWSYIGAGAVVVSDLPSRVMAYGVPAKVVKNMIEDKQMKKFIPVAVPHFAGNEKKYVDDCMDTTWISSAGKYVNQFEEKYAEFMGMKQAISCSNGTVALHVPLIALGLKPDDEVLVPSLTYIATANAVRYCGATPVFVDCLPDTWNIDPEDIKRKITPRTKGIIPVHLYGNPCDMEAIMLIAKAHDLFVLEDAAECHGASFKGQKAGTFGDVATFSFFGNKIITTGEGGMIVTDNEELAKQMRILKGQGQDPERRYWFIEVGYNYRMTNIEAAIGLAQLEQIDLHISNRRKVAEWYQEELKDMGNYVRFQKVTEGAESVWWMFSVLLKENTRISRDTLMGKLKDDGIETRPLFYPMHQMPVYEDKDAKCPISENVAANGLNLPTHALLSREDVRFICDKIKSYVM